MSAPREPDDEDAGVYRAGPHGTGPPSSLMSEPFLDSPPPKTQARASGAMAEERLPRDYKRADVQHAHRFTAHTHRALDRFGRRTDEIYLAGGGARNVALSGASRRLPAAAPWSRPMPWASRLRA